MMYEDINELHCIADELEKTERKFMPTIPYSFLVGNRYYIPSLCGGVVIGEVVDRSSQKGTVTIREEWMAEDVGRLVHADQDYVVTINDKGNEQFIAWKYHGHEAYVTADDYIGR